MPPRMIGLYALATMEREGPVHGYLLTQRIAARTAGAWRPGAGAVYPSLQRLVQRGLARRAGVGRRQEYSITPAGRATLRRIRARARSTGRGGPDLSSLWAEVLGQDDVGPLLVRRLERTVQGLASYLADRPSSPRTRAIRRSVAVALVSAREAIEGVPARSARRARRG